MKHDWYQNFSHVFVSYRIKKGGEVLKAGDLKVTFTPNSVQLESLSAGEILVHLDWANETVPEESTYSCNTKKIELKIKKKVDNINWIGLEHGSASTRVEAMQNNSLPSYPSSAKVKRDFNAIDKELDKILAKEGGEGDAALNTLFK